MLRSILGLNFWYLMPKKNSNKPFMMRLFNLMNEEKHQIRAHYAIQI